MSRKTPLISAEELFHLLVVALVLIAGALGGFVCGVTYVLTYDEGSALMAICP